MVEAQGTAAGELDEYCYSIIVSALTGVNDFHSTYCALADLLSLAQVCRTARRAAAVGLKELEACRGDAPSVPAHTARAALWGVLDILAQPARRSGAPLPA